MATISLIATIIFFRYNRYTQRYIVKQEWAVLFARECTNSINSKVTWTNKDSLPHTATDQKGCFDKGIIQPGQSITVPFVILNMLQVKNLIIIVLSVPG